LADNRRGDAVELVMMTAGIPREMVEEMRQTPRWAELEAMAPTIVYDSEVMGDISTGGTVPTGLLGRVTTESLVLVGGASPGWMIAVGRQVADALPNGRHSVLEGQDPTVDGPLAWERGKPPPAHCQSAARKPPTHPHGAPNA
jgi:hypothetical protein